MKHGPLVSLALISLLAGCMPPEKAAPVAQTPTASGQPSPSGAPPLDGKGNAPSGSLGAMPGPSVSAKDLDGLRAEVLRREKAGDPKAIAEAKMSLAMATMGSGLPPKEMYPQALQLFRDAAKLDPSNAKAQEWIGMIEGIYKGMKRPIPK